MATRFIQPSASKNDKSLGVFGPALALMTIAGLAGFMWLLFTSATGEGLPYFFLVPWILGLAIVESVPLVVLYYQGKLTLDNPIAFATLTYLFPAFVIGGLMLAFGWSKPYFLPFVLDPQENLPYTIIVIAVGHAGLVLGYFFPLAHKFGKYLGKFMPEGNTDPSAAFLPGFLLLAVGMINTVVGIIFGIIGYQLVDEISSYDGILYLTTLFWMQATFFLFYAVFKIGKVDLKTVLVVILVGGTAILKALFAGNRGGLITMAMPIVLAYVMSGRTFKFKQFMIAGTIGFLCLVVGMIYGTTFRDIKGGEARIDLGRYTENIGKTFDQVGRNDNFELLVYGFENLAERIDSVTPLAVVVSTYEQMEPYEEGYGLDNNIWKDTISFLIPRIIWNNKPLASEPRKYAALYFDYPDNSFTITPYGDLIRNFGIYGVIAGMFLLGCLLRIIFRALVEDQTSKLWKATMYFMLLTTISYEGFYGSIFPLMVKVLIITTIGLFVVRLLGRKLGTLSENI
jgi:hypothetical protein